jgi:hypothetical protein
MRDEMTLQGVFLMQDRAASYNEARSDIVKKRLGFVSDALALATEIVDLTGFPTAKHHAMRVLGVDILSTIATSVRVALWGNLPEGIAVLRCALETCAVLAATVQAQEYAVVAAEMQARTSRTCTYKKAIFALGEVGARINELHGRLSNIGGHANTTRFKFASYETEGQFYDRLGAALDPSCAELALFYTPDACLHLLESIEKAYLQDSRTCPCSDRLLNLRDRCPDVKLGSTGAA